MDNKVSGAELAKVAGKYLRGTIADELQNPEPAFSTAATSVLKFHGVYQQDDRDLRKTGVKQITCMVRVGVPGGILTSQQYLALDRLADLGDGTLRITTRQDIQYHYVPKSSLPELIGTLNANYLTTLAACGDVVRNTVSCAAPFKDSRREQLRPIVQYISRSLKPKTTAYYEIWVQGTSERVTEHTSTEAAETEPLYGAAYLPRKFKIGFAFEGDNTTDVYANDIGVVPHFAGDTLEGFTILAGGGMGQSAGVKASHPRLASPICFIGPSREELLEMCKAIVTIHRDFGNRANRKLARLKYVLDDWGVERFKRELEQRVGRALEEPRDLRWHRSDDYLGWHPQGRNADGSRTWFVGVRIISGRVKDFDQNRRIREGIRSLVEKFGYEVRLTPQQNLYFSGVTDQEKPVVAAMLAHYGIEEPASLPPVLRHALSCPALPTCGQAITESERAMPGIVAEIQAELNRVGLDREVVHLRTSGCPNGCARPYTAEIGIVGASVNMYTIYLGASKLGTRLGREFARNVKGQAIAATLRPVIEQYGELRQDGESFGDFCHRVGIDALRETNSLSSVG